MAASATALRALLFAHVQDQIDKAAVPKHAETQ